MHMGGADSVAYIIKRLGIRTIHATNGAYAQPLPLIRITMPAGVDYVLDHHDDQNAAIVVAVNSDVSVARLSGVFEHQAIRSHKVTQSLQGNIGKTDVIIGFYDEDTPQAFYDRLKFNSRDAFTMASLHKWGYGTHEDAPRIIGSENFEKVYGFPLPERLADIKPTYWSFTPKGENKAVDVVNLNRTLRKRGMGVYLNN